MRFLMPIMALFLYALGFISCSLSVSENQAKVISTQDPPPISTSELVKTPTLLPIVENSPQIPVMTETAMLSHNVGSVAFNNVDPTTGLLLAVATDRAVEVWDVSAQKLYSTLPYRTLADLIPATIEPDFSTGRAKVEFSPDGEILAIGLVPKICDSANCAARGVVYRWHVQTMTFLDPWVAASYNLGYAKKVLFTPDGKVLTFVYNLNNAGCFRTSDHTASWDVQSGNQLSNFSAGHILDEVFSPDSNLAVISYSNGVCPLDALHIVLMDTALTVELKSVTYPLSGYDAISRLAFSPDGQLLMASVVQAGNSEIYVLDSQTLQERGVYHFDDTIIRSVAFNPDGRVLLIGDDKGQLHFLDAKSGRKLKVVDIDQSGIKDIVISRNGEFLAIVSTDGNIHVWKVLV